MPEYGLPSVTFGISFSSAMHKRTESLKLIPSKTRCCQGVYANFKKYSSNDSRLCCYVRVCSFVVDLELNVGSCFVGKSEHSAERHSPHLVIPQAVVFVK